MVLMTSSLQCVAEGLVSEFVLDAYQHQMLFNSLQVIHSPLSVEGGTLTRTMKLRRPAVKQVYAQQLEQLMSRLRG